MLLVCLFLRDGSLDKATVPNVTASAAITNNEDATVRPVPCSVMGPASVENPRWAQNPQFHITLPKSDNNAVGITKNDVHLKLVLWRVDDHKKHTKKDFSSANGTLAQQSSAKKADGGYVQLAVFKAESLVDRNVMRKKTDGPRENARGEPLPVKESSLKKVTDFRLLDTFLTTRLSLLKCLLANHFRLVTLPIQKQKKKRPSALSEGNFSPLQTVDERAPLRVIECPPRSGYIALTTGADKAGACLYFASLPRNWLLPNGLIIVPSLSEKGKRAKFILEVYSSEPVIARPIADRSYKQLAGEWTESTARGCHIHEGWKRNPRFIMRLHSPGTLVPIKARLMPLFITLHLISICNICPQVRIALVRHGHSWRNIIKRDLVGTMIGFYVWIVSKDRQELIYEAPFVPDKDVASDEKFELEALTTGDEYIIQPATYKEGVKGAFVLSVQTEESAELTLLRGDSEHKK